MHDISYTEETTDLAVEIAAGVTDGKDKFLTVGGRLAMIEEARQKALLQLKEIGPGPRVPAITERLNVLNSLKNRIISTNPGARSLQRRLQEPRRNRR